MGVCHIERNKLVQQCNMVQVYTSVAQVVPNIPYQQNLRREVVLAQIQSDCSLQNDGLLQYSQSRHYMVVHAIIQSFTLVSRSFMLTFFGL